MRNLGILIKNNINCAVGALQGKKGRKQASIAIPLIVLGAIAISAVVGLQFYALFETFGRIGLGQIPIFNSIQVVLLLLVVLSFQNMTGKAKSNDSDFLLSMPLKRIEIILSKVISKYLFNVVLVSMIMIPTMVLYSIFIEISLTAILWSIYLLILLPLIGVGINYILDYVIVKVFNKMKHSNIFKTIFATVVLIVFMAVYIYNSSVMGIHDITTIDGFLNNNIIIGWCVKLITESNLIGFFGITLISIGIFAIGIILNSLIFGKTFMSFQEKNTELKFRSTNKMSVVFKKELKTYLTTPIYMFNTIISPIMLIVLTVFICIKGQGLESLFVGFLDKETMLGIIVIGCLFLSAMTLVSCCSISLESKSLWILKSTPISVKGVLVIKSLFNMFIITPVQIICSIVICLILQPSLLMCLALIILPILHNAIIAFGGTYINLIFPKFNWETEAQVVKSGFSTFISMILGMLLAMLPIILKLCNLSLHLCAYINLGLYVVLTVLFILLLLTDGVKRFNKLSC